MIKWNYVEIFENLNYIIHTMLNSVDKVKKLLKSHIIHKNTLLLPVRVQTYYPIPNLLCLIKINDLIINN